jgi:hypothetical protein
MLPWDDLLRQDMGEECHFGSQCDGVTRLMNERSKRTEVDADFVVAGLVDNYERAMATKPVLNAKGELVYKYNGTVVNKSLELLARHLDMLRDRHEVEQQHPLGSNFLVHLLEQAERNRRSIDREYIERLPTGYLEKGS